MGKSTLCKFICHQFMKKELWKNEGFEFVFFVDLKKIDENDESIIKWIINNYFETKEKDKKSKMEDILGKMIEENKILFVLDGFDELEMISSQNKKNDENQRIIG
jgi:hypothetical protein